MSKKTPTSKPFFDEQTEQSAVKAAIVSKYFKAWSDVMIKAAKADKIAYVDLFAGPGRYGDDQMSTPLLILQQAIDNSELGSRLATFFNDADSDHASLLEAEIAAMKGIKELKYPPDVSTDEITTDIVDELDSVSFIPSLFFFDPWGYKGLSLRLINAVLKSWGCECIFFFNYNRINMGLPNEVVTDHMNALFGEERADELREKLKGMKPQDRELAIVEALALALKEMGGEYVLPFRFVRPNGTRTSHHLIFVSKHKLGYKIMKDVMAAQSSGEEQGVPTFEYNPSFGEQGLLFDLARPLEDLGDMLLEEFADETVTFEEIYERHSYGHRFTERNYRAVLNELEAQGRVDCNPPANERRKYKGEPSFAKHVEVSFPSWEDSDG
ncbi:MAG: three-Cys-motif partner protein TcmP [Planctomycetaceae bacterium]|nr:three-Cys-motif partner protein TcmP [Planctomycetaceae bacterium]